MRFILIAGCFFICLTGHSQIINVESLRLDTDSNGFAGKETFSFSITQNTSKLISIDNNLVAQLKQNRHTFLFLNDLNYTFSESTEFEKRGFYHLRYNYRLNDVLTYEAFTQYQTNAPLRIERRWLLGMGPRINFVDTKTHNLIAGSLLMYEYDAELGTEHVNFGLRLSNYISAAVKYPNLKITTLVYYQPFLLYWNDFRVSSQLQVELKLYKSLWFALNGSLNYDAFPVEHASIPKLTYRITNGLSFNF